MLTIFLLEIMADLAFYYAFAGFFAALFGAGGLPAFAGMLIPAACYAISYPLSQKGLLRYLPIVSMASWAFIPGIKPADVILFIPAAGYAVALIAKSKYEPSWQRQKSIFSLFWKVFIPFAVIMTIYMGANEISAVSLPFAIVMMMSSVILMRLLRHDPYVYRQKRFQALNLITAAGVVLTAYLCSTKTFLDGCAAALKLFFNRIIEPVLMLLFYAAAGVVQFIAWLVSFIKLGGTGGARQIDFDTPRPDELPNLNDYGEAADGEVLNKVFTGLAIIAVIAVILLLFRYLFSRGMDGGGGVSSEEIRMPASPGKKKREKDTAPSTVQQIRAQYRKFLKLCTSMGVSITKSSTSLEVKNNSEDFFRENTETKELRDIYIGARYNGQATKRDVSQIKKICKKLKDELQ